MYCKKCREADGHDEEWNRAEMLQNLTINAIIFLVEMAILLMIMQATSPKRVSSSVELTTVGQSAGGGKAD